MDRVRIGKSELWSSRLVYGCMRIVGDGSPMDRQKGKKALHAALDAGYNHFDHADIYGQGQCELLFRRCLKKDLVCVTRLLLPSKCGIYQANAFKPDIPKHYNFSKAYIIECVDGILTRLGTDYLDILLLHRPDYLFDANEVNEAFCQIHQSGKVRYFGVSNFSTSQGFLLRSFCSFPLVVHQMEINIDRIDAFIDGTLDQCQQLDISPMAWCPLGGIAYPAWGETLSLEDRKRIQEELKKQAAIYHTEPWVILFAWLIRHPSCILPIVGSTTEERISKATASLDIPYKREYWYRLLEARNGRAVP